jgi:hypothetical protein
MTLADYRDGFEPNAIDPGHSSFLPLKELDCLDRVIVALYISVIGEITK